MCRTAWRRWRRSSGSTEAEIKRHYGEYLDMIETCAHCGSRRDCTHALEHAGTTDPEECGFCPNSDLYARKYARKVTDAIHDPFHAPAG